MSERSDSLQVRSLISQNIFSLFVQSVGIRVDQFQVAGLIGFAAP